MPFLLKVRKNSPLPKQTATIKNEARRAECADFYHRCKKAHKEATIFTAMLGQR